MKLLFSKCPYLQEILPLPTPRPVDITKVAPRRLPYIERRYFRTPYLPVPPNSPLADP